MVHLVARSNRVDERGRGGINYGENSLNNGIHKKQWMNCLWTGNGMVKLQIIIFCLDILITPVTSENHPHEPFKWSLIRWNDNEVIQSKTMTGPPSFAVGLCNLTDIEHCGKVLNQTAFYMCPSSNPGKSYCNYPGEYFCAYWGCETVASDWTPKRKDKYISAGFGPPGCTPSWRGPSGETTKLGTCSFVFINITQPEDQGWLLGRTWGIRHWEPGRDRGNLVLIKKETAPPDPLPNRTKSSPESSSTNCV